MPRRSSLTIARARVWAAKRFTRLLLGPLAGGIPLTYASSLIERMADPRVKRHVVEARELSPPIVEAYGFPEWFPPQFRRSKAFDQRYGYELADVIINPRSGLVWLPGGPLLGESYGSLNRATSWGDVRSDPLLPSIPTELPVIPCAPAGYFHWLLEVMPSVLSSLEMAPEAHLLMPRMLPPYASEGAQELVGHDRILYSDENIEARTCFVSSIGSSSGFVQLAEASALRASFLLEPDVRNELIYVSRLKDARRALSNEHSVEQMVLKLGGRVIYCQELSFLEQRRLFAGANLIVGPHGAGLANIVWANPSSRLIEILPTSNSNDCYARLSQNLNMEYEFIMSEEAPGSAGRVPLSLLAERISASS